MACLNFKSAMAREAQAVEAHEGESVMHAAVRSGVPGIIGECMGELNCGTCHAYVDQDWADRLPAVKADEAELIEVLDEPRAESRLLCQIPVSAKIDGLSVTVPDWVESASDIARAAPDDAEHFDVVIVGAGHGGTQLATSLVQRSPGLRVALLGSEKTLPYDRPALSKTYLLGGSGLEEIQLRSAQFWDSSNVALLLGDEVVGLDPARHVVRCASGRELGYGSLVWAAGGRARQLPAEVAEGPYVTIRELADADLLKRVLATTRHATLIGGGYIGLEAAAVFRSHGIEVTLIETEERLLSRVTGHVVSEFFEAEHRSAGVDIRLGRTVNRITVSATDGRTAVRLDDGSDVMTDLVVAGIGMIPNTEVLAEAGATVKNGVVVDEHCRTSLNDVYAIGDCAAHVNRFAGGASIRLECVQNAVDQAKVVECCILGEPRPYSAVPWFWSNQFDIRLKSAGLVRDADRAVVRGDPAARAFSVIYFRGDNLVAIDAINSPTEYMKIRQAIHDGASVDPDILADPSSDIMDAMRLQDGALA